jgi:glycosyltransferase involved in cell wall biosynthesis
VTTATASTPALGAERIAASGAGFVPARRRRLLMTVHSAVRGGATLMALTEARFLRDSYDLVLAVPPGPMRPAFEAVAPVVDGPPSLPIWTDSAARWGWRSLRTCRHALMLANVVRSRSVDMVLTNSSVSLSPVVAARLTGVPVVVHARDTPFSRWAPLLMRTHGRLADVIVANGSQTASHFPASARARVIRIPDGIGIPDQPATAFAACDGPIRLAVVGTLTHEKGQDVAIRALDALRRRDVDAELDVVGPEARPGDAGRLRELAGALGIGARVHVRGEAADIDEALVGIDIVVVTSRGESAGLVAMEALARAVPVVASNVGGVPDVVADGRTGLLVPAGDAGAVADAVVALLRDPDRTREMAARGRADMEDRFARDATLAALRGELDLILARS